MRHRSSGLDGLIGPGTGIHWPDIGKDISIAGLLGLPD
jgi:hypothetical protein